MTVQEAIQRTDELKVNTYSQVQKIAWLSQADGEIQHEIIDRCEKRNCCDPFPWTAYMPEDLDVELLAPAPYDELYIHWLKAQISLNDQEYDHYNAAMQQFMASRDAFAREYVRHHMPISSGAFMI